MKEKLYRFMQGRYGNDQLNRFIMLASLIFLVISTFTGAKLLYLVGLAGLLYAYFRLLSKNLYKRSAENQVYLKYEYRVKQAFSTWKRDARQRKTHHIYKCPSCRQKIRIPRGKGRIEVRCPKCGTTFLKRS